MFERCTGAMVRWIEKISEHLWMGTWIGQGQTDKFDVWIDLMDCGNHRIITLCVLLWCHGVFEIDFVEHFPISDFVVMSRRMILAKFIGESTTGIPTDEACIVIPQFMQTGIAQFRPLRIVPVHGIGV